MSHGTRRAGTALPGAGGTRRGSSLPVQLVELGHAATCGLSVHVPKEREVGLKRVVLGVVQKRAELTSAHTSPCCLGQGNSRTLFTQGTHTALQGGPKCSALQGP